MPAPIDRQEFMDEFVKELTGCQRPYISVHNDDRTDWTAEELASLAHDTYWELANRG